MQNYAIAEIAGRQFRIEEGVEINVPRLEAEQGETVTLDKVVLISRDGKVDVGTPYVDGVSVTAEVVDHPRGKKVWVFKKKRRKGFKKGAGARERLTRLAIKSLPSAE